MAKDEDIVEGLHLDPPMQELLYLQFKPDTNNVLTLHFIDRFQLRDSILRRADTLFEK